MKLIPLTKGKFAMVDDEDFDHLSKIKWNFHPTKTPGYASSHPKQHLTVMMHRYLMNPPKGMDVDHVDGNGLNNQKSNLRIATRSQNACNSKVRTDSLSGIKGVRWDKRYNHWQVRIYKDGKKTHLGCFSNLDEAILARSTAAAKLHGEFANEQS